MPRGVPKGTPTGSVRLKFSIQSSGYLSYSSVTNKGLWLTPEQARQEINEMHERFLSIVDNGEAIAKKES